MEKAPSDAPSSQPHTRSHSAIHTNTATSSTSHPHAHWAQPPQQTHPWSHTESKARARVHTHTGSHTDAGGHSRDTSPAGQMPAWTQAHLSLRHECFPCRQEKAGCELPTPEPGGTLCPVPTPLILLSSSLGNLWHCCKGGAAALGPQSREWKTSRTPVCPPPQDAAPLPLLGLGVLLPTPYLPAQGSPR